MSEIKSHPIVLFLHGALGTSLDFNALKVILEEKGLQTLSFDFSGHGKSGVWPEEFRIDLFARDLDAFLNKHHLKNVAVFGHSMGGYVALYHKLNFENSPLSTIMTYGTKFNWSENAVQKEIPMLNPEHLAEKFPNHAQLLKEKHGERWKALMRSTAHMMQNLEKLDGLNRDDFMDFDIPVMLMLGDQDRMVSSEETNLTASWIPHASVKTIAHSKHELERANIKEISEVILQELT